MRIMLLNPSDSTYNNKGGAFKKTLSYASLTQTTLASLVPEELNAEIKILDEGVEEFKDFGNADLVGISAITASAYRAYELADLARSQGRTVVLGGVHPTLMPEEASAHCDTLVTGFAEEVWPQLLLDFKEGKIGKLYNGKQNIDLSHLPVPARNLLKKGAYLGIKTIQASRGCTNMCDFCCIPVAWGRKHHHRPVDEVIDEIKSLKTGQVLFLDPSPVEDRVYAMELFKKLIPLKIKWGGLSTIKIAADAELLSLAVKSGCKGLLIGFETLNQKSLNNINKGFSPASEYREAVRILHDNGVSVLGCFVFGFEEDDKDVFKITAEFVDKAKIDLVRYSVYTPFPGTPAFESLEKQGRILTRDWSKYNTETAVFKPNKMTVGELQKGLADAWKMTYSIKSILNRIRFVSPLFALSIAANMGFKYYSKKVVEKTNA